MENREKKKCVIFLGFSGELVENGVWWCIAYLCEHRLVDVVTTNSLGVLQELERVLEGPEERRRDWLWQVLKAGWQRGVRVWTASELIAAMGESLAG